MFWLSVDLTGNQTHGSIDAPCALFWLSVDLTGNQTDKIAQRESKQFWLSVDLTGNQTSLPLLKRNCSFGSVSI